MLVGLRKSFPYLVLLLAGAALAWAVSLGTLPRAEFAFANGDEVRTIDPAKASGQPEHRVINALFEGLLRQLPDDVPPDEHGIVPLTAQPGVAAELPAISADGKVYTFRLRPEARWSNGDRVVAEDFRYSWRRTLHPETASEYAYQLYYLENAEKYNTARVEVGDAVEVELDDRPDPLQTFPRGTILHGTLREILKPRRTPLADNRPPEEQARAEADWKLNWVYVVEFPRAQADSKDPPAAPRRRAFTRAAAAEPVSYEQGSFAGPVERCRQVLLDFDSQVGVQAPDEGTLIVKLKNRTPYFHDLVAYYTLFPVHRGCVEKFGSPNWTKPENIVTNGPYQLQFRRIRDRIRLKKNPRYWDVANVHLNTVDAMVVRFETTQLNMYMSGQLDWSTHLPRPVIPELQQRSDFHSAPVLIVYFYRLNVARKPLDDVRVRRALNLAIDKQQICDGVLKAGEQPAHSYVPPGLPDYQPAPAGSFNVAEAQRLLAEAGYPGGRGMPKLEILYNTLDVHRNVAEVVQQQWKTHLGIDVELRNLEWGVYLDSVVKKDYVVSRAGWIGDYPDPNTFLDMFVTDGAQNNTNWSSPAYDKLIADAAAAAEPERRLQLLHDAERILMDELPILPLYFYVSLNLVNPRVEGFTSNIQDVHPLQVLRIRDAEQGRSPSVSLREVR